MPIKTIGGRRVIETGALILDDTQDVAELTIGLLPVQWTRT